MNGPGGEPLFLWVTRTSPFNLLTAKHLRAAGHNPLAIPVLETRPLAHRINAFGASAFIFTSPNGVRHHDYSPAFQAMTVFAVGDRTANLARETGYQRVYSAKGNALDLLDLIRRKLDPPARVLHLSAAEPAGDLIGGLQRAGYRAEAVHVYEAFASEAQSLRPALASLPWSDGVVIHSPRAGALVASFLSDLPGWKGVAYCISDAAAAPIRQLEGIAVKVAPEPNDASLRSIIGAQPERRLQAANESGPASDTVIPFRRPQIWQVPEPDDPPPSAA